MKGLGRVQAVAYSMGSAAAGLFYAFNNFTLPLLLSLYTRDAIIIGWLSSTRSFEQAIVQPLIGRWSDHTQTRLGRRAPFFLAAMPLSALFFILTASVPRDPSFLWAMVLCVFAFSFMFNVGIDPYVALLADVTPSEHRGTISGIAAVFGFFGQVAILAAASMLWEKHPEWVLYLVAAGLVVGFALVAVGVRERGQAGSVRRESAPRAAGGRITRNYFLSRWNENREAVKLLGVRVLFQFGINAAIPYLTLFVSTEIGTRGWPELVGGLPLVSGLAGMDAGGLSQLVAALLLLFTMLFALPSGWLGDRLGKKRVFGFGLLLMAISGLLAAFATTIPQLILYLVLLGLGNAAQTILFFPYLSDLVPPDRIGEFQGLSATAETGGVFLSVLVAGGLIDLNLFNLHYRLIFILTALFLLLGVLALLFVKPRIEQVSTPLEATAAGE